MKLISSPNVENILMIEKNLCTAIIDKFPSIFLVKLSVRRDFTVNLYKQA